MNRNTFRVNCNEEVRGETMYIVCANKEFVCLLMELLGQTFPGSSTTIGSYDVLVNHTFL